MYKENMAKSKIPIKNHFRITMSIPKSPMPLEVTVTEGDTVQDIVISKEKKLKQIKLSSSSSQSENEEEEVVDIVDKRWNSRKKRYEWKTKWGDGTITWEPKQNFVDKQDGEEVVNQVWLQFENKSKEKKQKRKEQRKERKDESPKEKIVEQDEKQYT